MYSARHGSSFALALGVLCVGGAYGALDEYAHLMTTRKITIPPFNLRSEDPDFQRYYGGAIVKLATAEAAVFHALETWEQAARDNVAGVAEFSGAMDNLLGGTGRGVMRTAERRGGKEGGRQS